MILSKFLAKNSITQKIEEENIKAWAIMALLSKTGEIRDAVVDFIDQYNTWKEILLNIKNTISDGDAIQNRLIYDSLQASYDDLNKYLYEIEGVDIWSRRMDLVEFLVDNDLTKKGGNTVIWAIESAELTISLKWICLTIGEFIWQIKHSSRETQFGIHEDMKKRYNDTLTLLNKIGEIDINQFFDDDVSPYFS